jgi:hypothetical protein
MAITALPTPPTRDDPQNFAERADEFVGAMPVFVTEANALAVDVNAKQVAAADSAAEAAISANNAQIAANAATSAAAYVGEYSTLSGALNIPASTLYGGRLYLLVANVADVTLHVPGVSDKWLLLGTYENPITISTNTNVAVFNYYRVTASCIATLPASPVNGQWVGFINKTGTSNFTVSRNGKTIEGTADDLNANVNHKTFRLLFDSSLNTWLILV